MKNRIFAALISAAVTLGVAVPTAAAAEKQQIIVGYFGDADGSGVVDSQDLPIYRDFLLAQTENGFDGNYLDTNADEIIDVFDLQRVRENLTRPDTSQAVMQEVEIPDNPPEIHRVGLFVSQNGQFTFDQGMITNCYLHFYLHIQVLNILPGFRIPLGSQARLMAFIRFCSTIGV